MPWTRNPHTPLIVVKHGQSAVALSHFFKTHPETKLVGRAEAKHHSDHHSDSRILILGGITVNMSNAEQTL